MSSLPYSSLDDVIFAAVVSVIARDPTYRNLPIWPHSAAQVRRHAQLVLAEVERALAQERGQLTADPNEDHLLLMLDGLSPTERRLIRSGALPDLLERALLARVPVSPGESA